MTTSTHKCGKWHWFRHQANLERNGSSLSKQMVPNIKENARSGIALQGTDREGNFFLEACDTTKAQSKAIAKQIAILAAVIKKKQHSWGSQISSSSPTVKELKNSWQQVQETHWSSRALFADLRQLCCVTNMAKSATNSRIHYFLSEHSRCNRYVWY